MSIVAISDTLGSFGTEIGRRVAKTRGYEFADREIIEKAAERFHEGITELTHVTEERPTLWERLTDTQHRYTTYVEAIIHELAARDNVVLVGRSSTILLRGIGHALRVRISAPEDVRAERLRNEQGLTQDAALDWVRQSDHERASRVKFLYHVDWDDPLLYDLVLNSARLSVGYGARLVSEALEEERFQTTEASRGRLLDLGLTAQAKAALLANPLTRPHQLVVECKDGVVSLSGAVHAEEARTAAEEVVRRIAGITGVRNEIVVVRVGRNFARGV